jgi:tripartite ATP-independent transporter DctM subunit
MEWWLVLIITLACLMLAFASGIPIAFAFLFVNIIGVYIFWGGQVGLYQLAESIVSSTATFILLPIPLFIFMGEVMFQSGLALKVLDTADKWMGRLPGRLGLLSVAAGTLFSTMTGVTQASIAMLGTLMVGDMERRGYKKPMSLGPILGSGGLAIMIPPSAFAVFLAALANISVAKVLIGGIIPGLCMAVLYASYIIIRCRLQPSIAPAYDVTPPPVSEKVIATVKYVLPLGFIVFLVIGLILLGVASPSEAAAMGVLGSIILAALHRGLNWKMLKSSVRGTIKVSIMIFMIIGGAQAFGQILAFSGASSGLTEFASELPLSPTMVTMSMLAVALLLGMFISSAAVLMVVIPIFMPVIQTLGLEPVWFGILLLLATEMSLTSPPFGLGLFTMKGVAPADTRMEDVFFAALPFLGCDLIVMILMIVFPSMVLWLPTIL